MSRLDDALNDIRGEIDGVIDVLSTGEGVEVDNAIGGLVVVKEMLDDLETEADDMEDEIPEEAIEKDDVEQWIDSAENAISEIMSDLQSRVRWGY